MNPVTAVPAPMRKHRTLKTETYPKGRRCTLCQHTLSVYNPGPTCWCHGNLKGAETLREIMESAA